jgi:hypothetical protein
LARGSGAFLEAPSISVETWARLFVIQGMPRPKKDELTLDQFVADLQGNLERFREFYLKGQAAKRPGEVWLSIMGAPDWFEQFVMFYERN